MANSVSVFVFTVLLVLVNNASAFPSLVDCKFESKRSNGGFIADRDLPLMNTQKSQIFKQDTSVIKTGVAILNQGNVTGYSFTMDSAFQAALFVDVPGTLSGSGFSSASCFDTARADRTTSGSNLAFSFIPDDLKVDSFVVTACTASGQAQIRCNQATVDNNIQSVTVGTALTKPTFNPASALSYTPTLMVLVLSVLASYIF